MRIVYPWLYDLVRVPGDPESVAHEIGLRGFEVASVEHGAIPVIDFEISANRPDCLSHIGMAREAATIWGLPLLMPDTTVPPAGPPERLEVRVEDPDLCPRYCAQVFEISVGPSPQWLADRLLAAGVRPISNIVDVTNYVMLELGQPMHAFDLERLGGRSLVIRRARPGERLRTLDGVDRALEPDMLVIADGERACAMGGVMGGHDSEIGPSTKLIALESAYFHPPSIRRTSKTLGLKTEASIRFERGGDIEAPPAGIARAAALFDRIGAGTPRGAIVDRYPSLRKPVHIHLRASRIPRLLGQKVPPGDVVRILTSLAFGVSAETTERDASWQITVPSFRVDVAREADLIEEVGRHYEFDRLPATFPALSAPQPAPPASLALERLIRQILLSAGFSEASTFAFMERDAAIPFCEPATDPAPIANPLSEKFAVMRPSLLPGLVDACAHNRRRERKDIQLFEAGSRFGPRARRARSPSCGAAREVARIGPRRRATWTSSTPRASSKGSAKRWGSTRRLPLPLRRPRRSSCAGERQRSAPAMTGRWCASAWSGRSRRRLSTRAASPHPRVCLPQSSTSRRLRQSVKATTGSSKRFPATHPSCATSRCSLTIPCLPPRFVARSGRRLRRRSCPSQSSTATRAKVFRTVDSACRFASRSVPRIGH